MKYENGVVYYTMDDIVDFIDAIKVDGANALAKASDKNEGMTYAVVGYNSALRKVRRELEEIDTKLMEAAYGPREEHVQVAENSDLSSDDTPPQDHTETQTEEINESTPNTVPEMGNIPPKRYAPV
jgi:hypothetical protein